MTKKINCRFTIEKHEEHGIVGAMPNKFKNIGWDSFIPTFRLSHELIDHAKIEFGALYQEVEALGAILYTRGWNIEEGYYAGQCYSVFIASDFTSIFQDADYSESYRTDLLDFPTYKKMSLSKREKEKFAKLFENLRPLVVSGWDSEINSDCESEDGNHENCDYCRENFYIENWETIKQSLICGYVKAKRRWNNLNVYNLRNAIDNEMKSQESYLTQFEGTGAEFSLQCEVDDYSASAKVVQVSGLRW